MYCMISSWPWAQVRLFLDIGESWHGDKSWLAVSGSFLSWWEEVFVLPIHVGGLWLVFLGIRRGLYSFGDLDNLVRRLWFSCGDYDFFVPRGDYFPLFLGIKFLCSWGDYFPLFVGIKFLCSWGDYFLEGIMIFFWGRFVWGDCEAIMIFFHLYQFIPQFVPTSPSMGEYGEGDPTSCVLFLSPALPGYCELGPGYGWQVKKEREDQGCINRT